MSLNRKEIDRQLLNEYAQRRQQNEREFERRKQQIAEQNPKVGRLLEQNMGLMMKGMRASLTNPQNAKRVAQAMGRQARDNKAEIGRLLGDMGYEADYLEESSVYRCKICEDSGYVGSPVKQFCSCFNQRRIELLYSQSSLKGVEAQTFENFDLGVFPDAPAQNGLSQRDQMAKVREYLEKYADLFPENPKGNVLLLGESGLGKTYLLNCVAHRVIAGGNVAVKVTAYRMLEAMRQRHITAGMSENGEMDAMHQCDLLLIDDLGTEPMMQNITLEYLFGLLNERIERGRCTLVATNLTIDELRSRYTERIASRLLDQSRTQVIRLTGRDVRLNPGR